MNKTLMALTIASSFFVAAQASAMTKDEYKVAHEQIEATYKVDKTKCDTLKDNANDVCDKEATGKKNVAMADLEQKYKPSASNEKKLAEEKVKAQYEVAKEKCDDLKSAEKDACVKQAKADEAKGTADIKAMKK